MEIGFVLTGHPLAVVFVASLAVEFLGTGLSFRLGCKHAFAMGFDAVWGQAQHCKNKEAKDESHGRQSSLLILGTWC
jgi:hypothetical protein